MHLFSFVVICKKTVNENTIIPILKVITVDDSSVIAQRTELILREIEGLAFLGNAFSISSAQNLINKLKPDVVILDINLSVGEEEQTGIDLLIELRQNFPEIKIIIFTNHNELHYRLICFEKGANYFFDKSNESHKIIEVLKLWMLKKLNLDS